MSAETTIFTQDRLFTALQGAAFAEASALARALTQAADAVALRGLQDQPVTVPGLSADAPLAVFQPIRLSVDNVVFLAQQAFGVNPRGFFVRPLFDPLLNAVRQRPPPLQNRVADALRQAVFALQETLDLILNGVKPAQQPTAGPTLRFADFTQRPSEFRAFGAAFAGVAQDPALNTQFAQRVGVASGGSAALADLIQFAGAGAPTNVAISLTGERGGGPLGEIRDGSGAPIADLSTVAFADLADLTYFAPATGVGLDSIGFIALNDIGNDGAFDGRGAFQTTVVSFAGAARDRREGDERIRDFFFGAEGGTAQTQIVLNLSGVASLGFTSALDAIQGGALRIRVFETLPGGGRNDGVVDLFASSGNRIVARFPFAPTQNGLSGQNIQVEIRALDLGFDISGVGVRAVFA